jgi:AraC-like DNA-binding protein
MSEVIRPQSPALASLVGSIAYDAGPELPSRRERILPSGRVSLMVNLHEDEFRSYHGPGHAAVRRIGGAMLAGPSAEHCVIDTAEQRRVLTVSFAPGGASPFFGVPLCETRDQLVELGDLWGRDGSVLRERLLEAATPARMARVVETVLLDRLAEARARGPAARDPAVVFAVEAFEHGAGVSEVAARLGLLPDRFARRFRGQVGLTPKRFSRVRRLQRLLRAVNGGGAIDWAGVAAEHGYFDQAHLINDFRSMTGLTPVAYLSAVGGAANHVPMAPRPADVFLQSR